MRGIVFHGERELELATLPDPRLRPRTRSSSRSRPRACAGRTCTRTEVPPGAPTIAGHEPAGVVVAAGAQVPAEWVGQRSWSTTTSAAGGATSAVRAGPRCAAGRHGDGRHRPGLARRLRRRCRSSAVLPMPDGLSYLAAAAISCGTGTAWGALKRLQLRGDDTIAIFGQGPVGLGGDPARLRDGRPGHRPGHLRATTRTLRGLRRVGDRQPLRGRLGRRRGAGPDRRSRRLQEPGDLRRLLRRQRRPARPRPLGVGLLGRRRIHHPLRPHRAPLQAGHRRSRPGRCPCRRWRTAPGSWCERGIDVDALFTDTGSSTTASRPTSCSTSRRPARASSSLTRVLTPQARLD